MGVTVVTAILIGAALIVWAIYGHVRFPYNMIVVFAGAVFVGLLLARQQQKAGRRNP
jgi:hypothetical protein